MAITRGQFFKLLKDILAKMDQIDRTSVVIRGGGRRTTVSTLALENLLTTISTTLSLLLTAFNAEDFATQTTLIGHLQSLTGTATPTRLAEGVERSQGEIWTVISGVQSRLGPGIMNEKIVRIMDAVELMEPDMDAIRVDMAALEVLITAGNVDLAALEVLITAGNVDLAALEVDLAAIEVLTTTSRDHLAAIESDTGPMQVDIAAIEVLLTTLNSLITTIDSVLDSMNSKLDTIDSIDYFLGNSTDAADLLSELQSIDANWNLLSVNQVAMAAVAVNTANNATTGKQDTAQTSFDTMLTDNDAMITDLAAIEVLLTTIAKQVTNHDWDFQVIETCSAAGTLIYAFQPADGDVFTDFWMMYTVAAGSGTIATIIVNHTNEGGGVKLRELDTRASYSKTSAVEIHIPTERPSTSQGFADGRVMGIRVPFNHKVFITFTTPAIGDVITIRCGAKTKTTSTPGDVKSGTGTFTQTGAVNDIRES